MELPDDMQLDGEDEGGAGEDAEGDDKNSDGEKMDDDVDDGAGENGDAGDDDRNEDTNLGMLEMAERGGGRNRNERSDSDSAEGEARGDTHAGGLLVSDPMARPVPLGSPSKKT